MLWCCLVDSGPYNIYITYKKSYISALTDSTLKGGEHGFTLSGTAKVFQLCQQDTPFSAAMICVGFLSSTSPKKLHKTTTQAGYQITAGISTISYLILSRYFSKPTITSNKEISKKNP